MRASHRSLLSLAALALLAACGAAPPPEPVAPVPLAEPAPEPKEDDASFLDVLSGQPTEIKIDGKPAGKTPISGYKVPAGQHEVTFLFTDENPQTVTVMTEANKGQTVKLDPVPNASGTMRGDDAKKKAGGDEEPTPKRRKK